MGFFDQIEDQPANPEKASLEVHESVAADPVELPPPPSIKPVPTKGTKVEKLAFLKPCPICDGRDFIYGSAGEFFCIECQPGRPGRPVLAAGPKRENSPGQTNKPGRRSKRKGSALYDNFLTGLTWIRENMDQLKAAGWDRPSLYRRGRSNYPMGNWGLAWLGLWKKNGLKVELAPNGRVFFTYKSNGKTITQSVSNIYKQYQILNGIRK